MVKPINNYLKYWFNGLLLLSFVCLAIYLFRKDVWSFPALLQPAFAVFSVVLLWISLLVEGLAWQQMFRYAGKPIQKAHAIASIGIPVFAKYIPAKVWAVLGQAGYIAQHYPLKTATIFTLSLQSQFISIFSAALIGLGFCIYSMAVLWVLIPAILLLILVLYTPFLAKGVQKSSLLFKWNIPSFLFLSPVGVSKTIPYYILSWGIQALAFYTLLQAIAPISPNPLAGLAFPLAAVVGIAALFVPGGIGVRESVLSFLLIHVGINTPLAISISVTSRLWYLIGEFFIFCIGYWAHCSSLKKKKRLGS